MQKIMFNDKYGLTKAVLEGRKTMTRRIVPGYDGKTIPYGGIDGTRHFVISDNEKLFKSVYAIGEVVAVAQSYSDASLNWINMLKYKGEPGWKNKMFVRAELMPHHIRITNVRVERLQDISVEDCIREGVIRNGGWREYNFALSGFSEWFRTPRDAFAALIDKVSGNGIWDRNPWVFAYEFELVK